MGLWDASATDTQFMISCKMCGCVCVCALVLLLEGIQACRWSRFLCALDGCKPQTSPAMMTNCVYTHTHTHMQDLSPFLCLGQKTLFSPPTAALRLQIILFQSWGKIIGRFNDTCKKQKLMHAPFWYVMRYKLYKLWCFVPGKTSKHGICCDVFQVCLVYI